MNGGPSGFNNAPITRAFVISCAIFTIVFGIQGRSNKLGFSYQDIFNKLQLWKLVVSVFAFASTPELMFGSYLLYYFRVFERQIGSNKHSLTFLSCIIGYYIFKFNERVFILFTLIVSSLLEVLALALLNDPSLNPLASGPYGLIFSSFVPFFLDIPVSTRFRVFSLRFSDKSFIYLVGIQLLLSSWKSSIIPGICGILAGTLYRLNIFCIGRMKFPEYIASFFSRLSWPSMGSTSPTAPTRNVPSYVGRQVEANHPAPVSLSSMVEPPEDSIATLVSMGFDRNSARQALVHARNDIDTATNILLESQSC